MPCRSRGATMVETKYRLQILHRVRVSTRRPMENGETMMAEDKTCATCRFLGKVWGHVGMPNPSAGCSRYRFRATGSIPRGQFSDVVWRVGGRWHGTDREGRR